MADSEEAGPSSATDPEEEQKEEARKSVKSNLIMFVLIILCIRVSSDFGVFGRYEIKRRPGYCCRE